MWGNGVPGRGPSEPKGPEVEKSVMSSGNWGGPVGGWGGHSPGKEADGTSALLAT